MYRLLYIYVSPKQNQVYKQQHQQYRYDLPYTTGLCKLVPTYRANFAFPIYLHGTRRAFFCFHTLKVDINALNATN